MSFTLSPNAKKMLETSLKKLKKPDLIQIAKLLKNELTFKYGTMKKEDLVLNLLDHLTFNSNRLRGIIEAIASNEIYKY